MSCLELLNPHYAGLIECQIFYAILYEMTYFPPYILFPHRRNVISLLQLYRYFHSKCSDALNSLVQRVQIFSCYFHGVESCTFTPTVHLLGHSNQTVFFSPRKLLVYKTNSSDDTSLNSTMLASSSQVFNHCLPHLRNFHVRLPPLTHYISWALHWVNFSIKKNSSFALGFEIF